MVSAAIAIIRPLFLENEKLCDDKDKQIALFGQVKCAEDMELLKSLSCETDIMVMDALEWQIINSENLVASFQSTQTSLYAIARSAKEAQVCFESLEKGTDGVVMKTEDVSEILDLKAYFASQPCERMALYTGIIQRVEQIGIGDRVCVDLCSILHPGEGLLVGSFARGLFLVHSECLKTDYVASRPFRVNAGPVHAYVALPGGKTAYLSELQTGMHVLVVDAHGFQRSAAVGRVKIETRPLILVEASLENDTSLTCSLLLQNAETVNLICPPPGMDTNISVTIPVTSLKAGDRVLLSLQDSARHTDAYRHINFAATTFHVRYMYV
ncbi:hypothetical protein GOP47_0017333 [Adiantum capillus-veneris]|uniref:3-dehydroquinate synthase n=1 Tax=Adiantum capillus-veneris TaxID=13818 RepID=A0A9D4ZAN4_ADICA|nr:hypothetical protein GOP47_0017333 [Adiantum capillus-veneris]